MIFYSLKLLLTNGAPRGVSLLVNDKDGTNRCCTGVASLGNQRCFVEVKLVFQEWICLVGLNSGKKSTAVLKRGGKN